MIRRITSPNGPYILPPSRTAVRSSGRGAPVVPARLQKELDTDLGWRATRARRRFTAGTGAPTIATTLSVIYAPPTNPLGPRCGDHQWIPLKGERWWCSKATGDVHRGRPVFVHDSAPLAAATGCGAVTDPDADGLRRPPMPDVRAAAAPGHAGPPPMPDVRPC